MDDEKMEGLIVVIALLVLALLLTIVVCNIDRNFVPFPCPKADAEGILI